MRHKYIRHSRLGFVLFPDQINISHAAMARLVMKSMPSGGTIVSAGFVWVGKGATIIEGKSESLNLGPAAGDGEALRKQLGWTTTN